MRRWATKWTMMTMIMIMILMVVAVMMVLTATTIQRRCNSDGVIMRRRRR